MVHPKTAEKGPGADGGRRSLEGVGRLDTPRAAMSSSHLLLNPRGVEDLVVMVVVVASLRFVEIIPFSCWQTLIHEFSSAGLILSPV